MLLKGSIEIIGPAPADFDQEQAELDQLEAQLLRGLRELAAGVRRQHQELRVVIGSIEVSV